LSWQITPPSINRFVGHAARMPSLVPLTIHASSLPQPSETRERTLEALEGLEAFLPGSPKKEVLEGELLEKVTKIVFWEGSGQRGVQKPFVHFFVMYFCTTSQAG
jgi:hypothetical protein